jgi:hypothetical protein
MKTHKLLEPLVAGRSEQWIEAMSQEPNPLATCMEIVDRAYGELVDSCGFDSRQLYKEDAGHGLKKSWPGQFSVFIHSASTTGIRTD